MIHTIRLEEWKVGRLGVGVVVPASPFSHPSIPLTLVRSPRKTSVDNNTINRHVIPRFKRGDFGGGIFVGVRAMAEVIAGEALDTAQQPAPQTSLFPARPNEPLSNYSSSQASRNLLLFLP